MKVFITTISKLNLRLSTSTQGTWRFKIPNYILRGITLETVPDTEIAFPLSSRLADPQFPFFFPGHEPSIIPQCQNQMGPKN